MTSDDIKRGYAEIAEEYREVTRGYRRLARWAWVEPVLRGLLWSLVAYLLFMRG